MSWSDVVALMALACLMAGMVYIAYLIAREM